jgi:hypothetical protein
MPVDPLRDQQGKIVPHDHPDILDTHHVIRHTVPNDLCPVDTDPTKLRLSSGAFSESSDGGMSVDLEEWMTADGLTTLHYITDPSHGAVRINVGRLRALGFKVGWDPDSGHKHHGCVWGINGPKKRKRIAPLAVTLKKVAGEN